MKKVLILILMAFVCTTISFNFSFHKNERVFCGDGSSNELETIIGESVNSQLSDLDFSDLQQFVDSMTAEESNIFGNTSFIEKIKALINGEYSDNQNSIWQSLINFIFDNILNIIPVVFLVIAIGVSFSLVSASRPQSKNKSLGDIIHFVCYGAIIVILITSTTSMITLTSNTIQSIKTQIDIVMPILLTVMTAIGGTMSVSVYQPAVAVLSGTIIAIFTNLLLPIFIFRLVFSIVSNLSNNVKLDKFASFFSSLFKWIIGGVFTVFTAFLAIQGITAASVDGISIKTAKYAIKNSVPLLGSYLSDGLNLIVASSMLVKNAVGAGGLLLLFSTIILPVIKLVVFMFGLKFASAVLEPITDSKISNFISMLSKSISLLIIIILGCAFSYVLLSGMIMCTANIV